MASVSSSLPDASSSAYDDDDGDSIMGVRSQVSGYVGSMPSIVTCWLCVSSLALAPKLGEGELGGLGSTSQCPPWASKAQS